MVDTCDDGQVQDLENTILENTIKYLSQRVAELEAFHAHVAQATGVVHESDSGWWPGEEASVLVEVRRLARVVSHAQEAGYAACQADVVAYFESLGSTRIVQSISAGKHVGAAKTARLVDGGSDE